MKLLELPPKRLISHHTSLLLNSPLDMRHLRIHLLGRSVWIYPRNHCRCLLDLAVGNQVARRLGALWHRAEQNDGRNAADGDHVAPSVGDFCEAGAEGVGDELAECYADVVEGDHAAAVVCRCEFSDIKRLFMKISTLEFSRSRLLRSVEIDFVGNTYDDHSS